MRKRRRPREGVPAIHQRDLSSVLDQLALLQPILQESLRCGVCGKVLTLDNLQCLYMENNEIRACCSAIECYQVALDKRKVGSHD
jgi:hypothetical protein